MRALGSIFVTALLASSLASATPPCNRPVSTLGAVVLPADGTSGAPRNTAPILRFWEADDVGLLDASDAPIPFRVAPFTVVDGFGEEPFLRLVPESDLPAGESIRIVRGDEVLATFTVGDARDDEPPPAPRATFAGPYREGACTPYASVTVETDSDDAVLFVAARSSDGLLEGRMPGISLDENLAVSGEANEQVTYVVGAVDLAGNVSAPVEVTVELPDDFGVPSCGATTANGAPLLAMFAPLALAPLALARRRRDACRSAA